MEAVIGLEIHAQLSTGSKIFCSCPVGTAESNLHTCPICAGHPGTLPVLNEKAVDFAIRAGLATGCTIRDRSVFARKNYFYPDLPKGYQISQYERPICENGTVEIELADGRRKSVRLHRIHLEEDAGKNVHMSGYSLVNLNRAGVPLVEIVSAPDMSTPEEAGAYMRAIHAIVTYLGICDGNMQEGNFRCDANVSVRARGATVLGTRVEIKNVNSFRFIEKAIEFEIHRQIEVVKAGGKIVQETRLFDSSRGVTQSMRSKEEAHDYRYFPDPDLLPVAIEAGWIDRARASLPELPAQKRERYVTAFGLSPYDASQLTASRSLAGFFESCVAEQGTDPKKAANLITGEIARLLNEEGIEIGASRISPQHVAELVRLSQESVISSTGAKQVIGIAWKTGEPVSTIVDREGLRQVSDTGALDPVIDRVLAANPSQVAEFKAGKDKLIGFFVGQVMKESGGKANPALVQNLIRKKLS